jgi:hypothetical protein
VSVIVMSTGGVRQILDKPLEDTIPNVHDAVEPGRVTLVGGAM